jgi:hypothetical protein
MNFVELFKELTARSSVLWGVAIASLALFAMDRWIAPLSLPPEWWWVLPVTACVSWAILLAGLAATIWTKIVALWTAPAVKKRRNAYALRNLETAGKFERMVLVHYKSRGQQRFRAPDRQESLHEMERHGFLDNDTLDRDAYMQHFRITDCVWKFLDAPPAGWAPRERLAEVDWDR